MVSKLALDGKEQATTEAIKAGLRNLFEELKTFQPF